MIVCLEVRLNTTQGCWHSQRPWRAGQSAVQLSVSACFWDGRGAGQDGLLWVLAPEPSSDSVLSSPWPPHTWSFLSDSIFCFTDAFCYGHLLWTEVSCLDSITMDAWCYGHLPGPCPSYQVHGFEELVAAIPRCGCELDPFQLCSIHVCQCGPVACTCTQTIGLHATHALAHAKPLRLS